MLPGLATQREGGRVMWAGSVGKKWASHFRGLQSFTNPVLSFFNFLLDHSCINSQFLFTTQIIFVKFFLKLSWILGGQARQNKFSKLRSF